MNYKILSSGGSNKLYQHNILMSFSKGISNTINLLDVSAITFQLISNSEIVWTLDNAFNNLDNLCKSMGKSIAIITSKNISTNNNAYPNGLLEWDITTSYYVLNVGSTRIRLNNFNQSNLSKVEDSAIQIL